MLFHPRANSGSTNGSPRICRTVEQLTTHHSPLTMPLAVIFDVDGVLVDSYQAHFEGWLRAGKRWGFTITESQFAQSFGRTSREVIVDIFGLTQLTDRQIKQLDEEKEA